MKKTIALVVFSFVFFIISGCLSVTQKHKVLKIAPIKEVELKKVELEPEKKQFLQFKKCSRLFLKNNVKLPNSINFFTVSSVTKFKSLLGITKTILNTVKSPDFNKNILVIIGEQPSATVHDIVVNKVYMKKDNIYVEYEIKEQESNKGYFVQNLGVFEIEKPAVILNTYFINIDNKTFVVPFGNRHDKSPSSVSDMLENYTGLYKGIVPAAYDNKIFVELNLKSDYSYTLKQEYLSAQGRVFEYEGKWHPSVDLSSFALNKNKDLIFYFIDKKTVEKLSNTGERLESEMYILRK
ncbi:MAG: copper resistance protein NlpE [Endomicrobium sp.]|jgi:hypothetical protein|nr:copper resistance protein NlpE [Endomicrobium sp.]